MKNKENSRRNFIKTTAAAIALSAIGANVLAKGLSGATNEMPDDGNALYTLPALPYAYDALEPHIDRQTMEIHHTKHHQAYINNLNKAVENNTNAGKDITSLCASLDANSPSVLRNNAGGHYNHSLFWTLMTPGGKSLPQGSFADTINTTFGSLVNFKEKFSATAMSRFGSGWAWLVVSNGKLTICNSSNQDNPLMPFSEAKGAPLLALDVWEHAYYLKYQNRRAEYITAWWNIVNWEKADALFKAVK